MRRALVFSSVALNVLVAGALLAAVLRDGSEVDAGLGRAPAIPFRAEQRLSMTRIPGGLEGPRLDRWRSRNLARLRALLRLRTTPRRRRVRWTTRASGTKAWSLAQATVPSTSGGDRFVVHRLLPARRNDDRRKPAAVLAIPGSGERTLDGLLGRVEDYQRAAAARLAEHGYAVYLADSFGTGTRAFEPGWLAQRGYNSQHIAGMYGVYSGNYLATILLADLATQIAVIRADPAVDGRRIATFGISRGGTLSMLTAALDPEVRGAVVASGLRDEDRYSASYFDHVVIPSQGRYFLHSDIAGTMAPRPMLITYGRRNEKRDQVFGEAFELRGEVESLRTAKRTRAIYRMFGAGPRLRTVLHAQGHTWDERSTFAFLRALFGY